MEVITLKTSNHYVEVAIVEKELKLLSMKIESDNHKELYQRVTSLEANYRNMKEWIIKIDNQVSNHLPTKIEEMEKRFSKKVDSLNNRLLVGLVVLVITQIILKIFV